MSGKDYKKGLGSTPVDFQKANELIKKIEAVTDRETKRIDSLVQTKYDMANLVNKLTRLDNITPDTICDAIEFSSSCSDVIYRFNDLNGEILHQVAVTMQTILGNQLVEKENAAKELMSTKTEYDAKELMVNC